MGPESGLGCVWFRVGLGDGVEKAGIAAEGAEDLGCGFKAAKEVHLGVVVRGVSDERDQGAALSLKHVEARLGKGLSRRLGSGRGSEVVCALSL